MRHRQASCRLAAAFAVILAAHGLAACGAPSVGDTTAGGMPAPSPASNANDGNVPAPPDAGGSAGATEPNAGSPNAAPGPRGPSADDQNLVVGPNYVVAAAYQKNTKVPAGKRTTISLDANVNRFFDPNNDFNRAVTTYVPAQAAGNAPLPLLVVQDGDGYTGAISIVLDNLIAAGKVPPMVAVFISAGPGNARSVEYDTVSGAYADFVTQRVLPRAAAAANVTFSTDPNLRATFGGSSGGAAAFTMAWFRPNSFRRVCTYSGSYTGIRPTMPYPHGAWSYHESLIAAAPYSPGLRVALEVGEHDHVFDLPYRNTIVANQQMAEVLTEKGYPTRFVFGLNAGHVDGHVIAQTMPDAFTWMWQDLIH